MLNRAEELARKGRTREALAAFSRAADETSANRAAALGGRAHLLRHIGRYEEALKDYEELVAAEPENLDALFLRAETLLLCGRLQESESEIKRLVSEYGSHPKVLDLFARYQAVRGQALPSAQPPHSPPVSCSWPLNAVTQRLEEADDTWPASCSPEIGRFLYDIVRLVRPALALETGTFIAYSSLCMAQALEHNDKGRLHSFDIFFDRDDYVSPVLGPCSDGLQTARGHLEAAGLAHRCIFHKGDAAETIRAEFHGRDLRFDLALIDADHTVSGCLSDWNAVSSLLRDGAVVVLHDVNPEKCAWLGPWDLTDKLRTRAPEDFQILNLPSPEGFGLAVIQKTSSRKDCTMRFSLRDLLRDWLYLQHHPRNRPAFAWRAALARWFRQ